MAASNSGKKAADVAFEKLCNVLEERVLNHEVKAIERLLTEKLKKHGQPTPFTIKRKTSRFLVNAKPKAKLFQRPFGAEIWYAPNLSLLEQMVVIGHELGHTYLEHPASVKDAFGPSQPKDPFFETQASYFAKLLTWERSSLYWDDEYVNARRFSQYEIDAKLRELQPDYDESILDKPIQ